MRRNVSEGLERIETELAQMRAQLIELVEVLGSARQVAPQDAQRIVQLAQSTDIMARLFEYAERIRALEEYQRAEETRSTRRVSIWLAVLGGVFGIVGGVVGGLVFRLFGG
jgi:CHASE3 domain sensor protein